MLKQVRASRTFKIRDLVVKETGSTTQDEGKLGPRWEGPYVVVATNRSGSSHLRDSQGNELLRYGP